MDIVKVVCISKDNSFVEGSYMAKLYEELVIGEVYDSINYSDPRLNPICGILVDGVYGYDIYASSCFITLREYRKRKLRKLNECRL